MFQFNECNFSLFYTCTCLTYIIFNILRRHNCVVSALHIPPVVHMMFWRSMADMYFSLQVNEQILPICLSQFSAKCPFSIVDGHSFARKKYLNHSYFAILEKYFTSITSNWFQNLYMQLNIKTLIFKSSVMSCKFAISLIYVPCKHLWKWKVTITNCQPSEKRILKCHIIRYVSYVCSVLVQ